MTSGDYSVARLVGYSVVCRQFKFFQNIAQLDLDIIVDANQRKCLFNQHPCSFGLAELVKQDPALSKRVEVLKGCAKDGAIAAVWDTPLSGGSRHKFFYE